MQHDISSIDQLEQFTQNFARQLQAPVVIALQGELGTGKTTFSQHLLRHLGITQQIPSPTFTLINEYAWDKDKIIFHLDLYRLKKTEELIALGLTEMLSLPNALVLIEWPELATSLLPAKTRWLKFSLNNNNKRTLYETPHQ